MEKGIGIKHKQKALVETAGEGRLTVFRRHELPRDVGSLAGSLTRFCTLPIS